MKTKKGLLVYPFLLMGFFLTLTISCGKDDDNNNPAQAPTGQGAGTVTDIDGNVYQAITFGTQTWMAENLKTTKYSNGDAIPNVTDNTQWSNLTFGAYCNNNNDAGNSTTYGRLYNWFAVNDSRKIAPAGWHVATDAEWTTLTTYWGGGSVAGGKLKETGTTHWAPPNTGATNASGFTALPGGSRGYSGIFDNVGNFGTWWSSTELPAYDAWYQQLGNGSSGIGHGYHDKSMGYSVCCVRD